MNRRQRLEATLAGKPTDRVPVAAWGHFYDRETTAAGLAGAMLDFAETYDWDFIKIHARASYHVEDWGFAYEPSTDPARLHRCTGHPIREPSDWRKLRPLPLSSPALAEQFEAIRLIRAGAPADMPLIMTVFSPLDIAEKLVDRDADLLKRHIEADPEAIESALAAFAETFAAFVAALPAHGVDGLFFSTKWANDSKLPASLYDRLVRPYDLAVLRESKGLWCRILHLCEDRIQLSALADYPVDVLHWDAYAGHNPGYGDGKATSQRVVAGGVDAATLANASRLVVQGRARACLDDTARQGFLLGPGCSVQIARTPPENLRALRAAAEPRY